MRPFIRIASRSSFAHLLLGVYRGCGGSSVWSSFFFFVDFLARQQMQLQMQQQQQTMVMMPPTQSISMLQPQPQQMGVNQTMLMTQRQVVDSAGAAAVVHAVPVVAPQQQAQLVSQGP